MELNKRCCILPNYGSPKLCEISNSCTFFKSQKIDARVPKDKRQTQILGRATLCSKVGNRNDLAYILVIRKKKPPQVVEKSPRTNKPIIYMHLRAQYYYCCRSLTFAALYYSYRTLRLFKIKMSKFTPCKISVVSFFTGLFLLLEIFAFWNKF